MHCCLWALAVVGLMVAVLVAFEPPAPPDALASPGLIAWRDHARARFVKVEIPGLRLGIYAQDRPCRATETKECKGTILLLHGFPTSSFDYRAVADILQHDYRVVMFDFPGYGLSDKPSAADYSYSLIEQADIALLTWKALGVTGGHLVTHDMGDSVGAELMARMERDLLPSWFDGFDSLTLTNGGVLIEMADFRIGQVLLRVPGVNVQFAKLANYWFFRRQIASISSQTHPLPEAEIAAMWEALEYRGGRALMPTLVKYLDDRFKFGSTRWFAAFESLDIPFHLMWGQQDTVAPPAMGDEANRRATPDRFTKLDHLGHFAMVEDPQLWAAEVLDFLASL